MDLPYKGHGLRDAERMALMAAAAAQEGRDKFVRVLLHEFGAVTPPERLRPILERYAEDIAEARALRDHLDQAAEATRAD